ncbi:TetR/AcrR family transcriptional regulator [Fodinicola acaciae]|uniref:TetR/AcrR family transcriptional regulator n=1 Tax=Fodinicola acaciae TaxID=2681555 RepID=UPI0013D0FAB8|nr:TetR/AcrR family transcriptional regulator [Fodinicola acaciae]
MARLTRAEQQRRTHQQLLEVGLAVFLRRGYLAATVEEIASEAGFTRGAVYKHFGGKEGLWTAIVDSRADALLAGLREALDRVSSRDELVATLASGVGSADGDAARWTVVSTEFLAGVADKPELAAAIVAAQRQREEQIAELLARHCDRLRVRPTLPLSLAVVALPSLGGGLALRRGVDPAVDLRATVTAVVEVMFDHD